MKKHDFLNGFQAAEKKWSQISDITENFLTNNFLFEKSSS